MAKLNYHATQRFYERTENVSKKEMLKALKNPRNRQTLERQTNSRSLIYILMGEQVVKAVYNRNRKEIITILPWEDIYLHIINLTIEDKTFEIELYPDCYKQTEQYRALNKVYLIEGDIKKEIPFTHPDFIEAFEEAWKIHEADTNELLHYEFSDMPLYKKELG